MGREIADIYLRSDKRLLKDVLVLILSASVGYLEIDDVKKRLK